MRLPDHRNDNVTKIDNHPTVVEKRVHAVACDADNLQFSLDINQLNSARQLQISTIITCLRTGQLEEGSLQTGGDFARGIMSGCVAGMIVRVESFWVLPILD